MIHFNTSYVVLPGKGQVYFVNKFYFNTSYVSVLRICKSKRDKLTYVFQYILCVGFSAKLEQDEARQLNFNTSYVSVSLPVQLLIKIKHMDFNTSYVSVSRAKSAIDQLAFLNFNTSYVSVSHKNYIYLQIIIRISIHLMCRFLENVNDYTISLNPFQYILCVGFSESPCNHLRYSILFQYILCVGFSKSEEKLYLRFADFNTSYVSISRLRFGKAQMQMLHFNTSYVSVSQRDIIQCAISQEYFNTSYVSVSLLIPTSLLGFGHKFQYILCVGFSYIDVPKPGIQANFNTSYRTAFYIHLIIPNLIGIIKG